MHGRSSPMSSSPSSLFSSSLFSSTWGTMTSTTTAEQRIGYEDRDDEDDKGDGDPSYCVPLGPNGGRQKQRRPSSPSSPLPIPWDLIDAASAQVEQGGGGAGGGLGREGVPSSSPMLSL